MALCFGGKRSIRAELRARYFSVTKQTTFYLDANRVTRFSRLFSRQLLHVVATNLPHTSACRTVRFSVGIGGIPMPVHSRGAGGWIGWTREPRRWNSDSLHGAMIRASQSFIHQAGGPPHETVQDSPQHDIDGARRTAGYIEREQCPIRMEAGRMPPDHGGCWMPSRGLGSDGNWPAV